MTNLKTISDALQQLPNQVTVKAQLEDHRLADVAAEVTAQLVATMDHTPLTGRTVAIAVGSRGINQIDVVARAAVAYLKSRGARPFIVPAMGSHGGATAEGQRDVLATLGVTEESAGTEILDAMNTIELGRTASGTRLYLAEAFHAADLVLMINRVKPHTDIISDIIGSGLRKMAVIGLGKADGSFAAHHAVSTRGYESVLVEAADHVLSHLPRLFGLALVEDGYHQLARIEAMPCAEIAAREPALLGQARAWMPRLPFPKIDVLILDQIGKNISGAGMDPNVIGRDTTGRARADRTADVRTIYVRGLTPETHGNAIGLGMADVVSQGLVDEMDRASTYTNALSAMAPAVVRTPMHFPTEAECLHAAIRMSGATIPDARILRIKNTLALDEFIATENYANEIAGRAQLQIVEPARPWLLNAV